MSFLTRIRGERGAAPRRSTLSAALTAGFGGFLAIGALAWLALASGYPLVLGSFGASVVLLFCLPEAPVAQPRNLVGGHFISSLTGLACLHLCGPCWQGMALAVGLAIVLMMLTGTVHPPGNANTIIVFVSKPDWSFLLTPTLAGAVILLAIALVYNNLTRRVPYPRYW